jgi:hypothetical protein
MGIQGIDLSLIWGVIIAFGVMMYVIMDGFDLGLGILFPLIPDEQERDVMTPSRRCGTVTRPGWCSVARRCMARFRWRTG